MIPPKTPRSLGLNKSSTLLDHLNAAESLGTVIEWLTPISTDESYAAGIERVRKEFERTDARDIVEWFSMTGCCRWPLREESKTTSAKEWLVASREDKGRVFRTVGKKLQAPEAIRIVLSQFGYHVESDYGPASPQEVERDRLLSAVLGFPPKGYTTHEARETAQKLSIVEVGILREWTGHDVEDAEIEHLRSNEYDKDPYFGLGPGEQINETGATDERQLGLFKEK